MWHSKLGGCSLPSDRFTRITVKYAKRVGAVASNHDGHFEGRPGSEKEEELEVLLDLLSGAEDAEDLEMRDALLRFKYEKEDQWQAHFHALEAFLDDTEGRFPLLSAWDPTERELRRWVDVQRSLKDGLDKARYQQLNRCKWWNWDGIGIRPPPRPWGESLDRVKKFKDDNGRWPTDDAKKREERRLGNWVVRQRNEEAYMKIAFPGRYQQLETCGWWVWEVDFEAQWQENLDAVKQFIEDNGGRWPSKGPKKDLPLYFRNLHDTLYRPTNGNDHITNISSP